MSVVVVALPVGPSPQTAMTPHVGAAEAFSAAMAAVSDMRKFCARQPEACAVGSEVIVQFGQITETKAKRLYEFLNERKDMHNRGAVAATNSVEPGQKTSRDTLTVADRATLWNGPQIADRTGVSDRVGPLSKLQISDSVSDPD
jgi:Family of unknown function (DUF5330)